MGLNRKTSALILGFSATAAVAAPTEAAKRDSQTALKILQSSQTANGFSSAARGWNSFGIQANSATVPGWSFNQANVQTQCDVLASKLSAGKYTYCSLDSGWSVGGNGDDNGRIIFDDTVFNIPQLAQHLHGEGLQLGVYVVPGGFVADEAKTILGTNTTIGEVCSGNNGLARCNWDYSQAATQAWHDSCAALFASWGVDLVKLDFVTPGSPNNGDPSLPADQSGAVIAWHNAIKKSGRQMRLDISWKLDRTQQFFNIWNANADTMRTDMDINNSGSSSFVQWSTVQRAIDQYRQWTIAALQFFNSVSIHPDMDNLFVGNSQSLSGITDAERQTVMTHWVGAGANLILGSDLTHLDQTGINLLTNPNVLAIADFTAQFPMQPRNPGNGGNSAQQLQAWIAGPSPSGEAVVVLANYGPDQGSSGFSGGSSSTQTVKASWSDLGISGSFNVQNVWNNTSLGTQSGSVSASLAPGQSVLLKLTRA